MDIRSIGHVGANLAPVTENTDSDPHSLTNRVTEAVENLLNVPMENAGAQPRMPQVTDPVAAPTAEAAAAEPTHTLPASVYTDEAHIQEVLAQLPSLEGIKSATNLYSLRQFLKNLKFLCNYPIPETFKAFPNYEALAKTHVNVFVGPEWQLVASQAAVRYVSELFEKCFLLQNCKFKVVTATNRWEAHLADLQAPLDESIFSSREAAGGVQNNIEQLPYLLGNKVHYFMTANTQYNSTRAADPMTPIAGMAIETSKGVFSQGTVVCNIEEAIAEAMNVLALAGFNGLVKIFENDLNSLYANVNGYLVPNDEQIDGVVKGLEDNWSKLSVPCVTKENVTYAFVGAPAITKRYHRTNLDIYGENTPEVIAARSTSLQRHAALGNFQAQFNAIADKLAELPADEKMVCILTLPGCGMLRNDEILVGAAFKQCALAFQKHLKGIGIGSDRIQVIFERHPNNTAYKAHYEQIGLKEKQTVFGSEFSA